MKYWIAQCESCGTVKRAQKSKPTSCTEEIRTGERSIRRCGNELTNHQDITAKVEAAKAAQAHAAG
ncbi:MULTISPECIES: hypothetical protein [Pseudomonas]|uniref:Uncharacterized protein n=1 Tax=Pseudomonas aeruginosa TaxID=287 RepID=A0A3G1DGI0_PSEAI|nr:MULTISPECIES: hypothetical protein [Pseudomonas]MCO6692669.1 hypothetical protein [Pseudomonas shirazica]AMP35754.1 Hypothetical protein [Pseudomonas aeruginosa]MBA6092335.1 hypothetical protein [Pseudomonas monteilii]MCE0755591.1 hypothetical protein [Pseudomonas asiatica]MCE0853407.1 hypothetical protein [Pseudomonas asiatica]